MVLANTPRCRARVVTQSSGAVISLAANRKLLGVVPCGEDKYMIWIFNH